MGRVLEFALATALITIVHVIFALFVVSIIGNRVESLFTDLNNVFASL